MHMEKKSFLGSRAWWGCVLMTITLWCHSVLLLLLAVRSIPLAKPGRMGNGRGGGGGVVLGKEHCRAGEAPASAQPCPGLWPRQSFRWCTSGFTWARNRRPCWLSKQPGHRTLLCDPSGSSHRLWVLCASLSRAHSVLWAFPLYFTPALHSAMPRFITSFQIKGLELKDRVLPSCFPSPGKCGSCLRARVMTHQHFLSKSSCCLFQFFPLPEPREKRGCWEAAGLGTGEDVVWQPGPDPLLHPSWQKINK